MISESRQYIIDRINYVCPELHEWQDAFNAENIPQNIIDTRYHIEFSDIRYRKDDLSVEKDIRCELKIFKRMQKFSANDRDIILDKANSVMDELCVIEEATKGPIIFNVVPDSISSSFQKSNDNLAIVSIIFNIISIKGTRRGDL